MNNQDLASIESVIAAAQSILDDADIPTLDRRINFQNKAGTDYCYCYIDDEGNLVGDVDEFKELFME